MASSRKQASADVAVGPSGGVDSVVLLHLLGRNPGLRLQAIHVHHGLSPNADSWTAFCRQLCKRLAVPLTIKKIRVVRKGKGLEAAARAARYKTFGEAKAGCIALAHNLDDQAETVLMNLLRGAGARGASGMPVRARFGDKTLWRPLLGTPCSAIEAYARRHRLDWIEDESNADEALTRNFIRRRIGPLLEQKFPHWKESLARAARHFSKKEAGAEELLRHYLRSKGLQAPSEANRDAEAARLGQPAREARARRCDAADLPRQGISRRRAVVRILAAAMERAAAPEAARARRRAALSQGARQRHRARAQVLERAPALRRRAPPARPQAPAPHSEEPLSGSRHPALGARAPSLAIQWRGPGLGPRPRYRRALPSVARLTGSGARMALPLCSKAHRRNTLLRVK